MTPEQKQYLENWEKDIDMMWNTYGPLFAIRTHVTKHEAKVWKSFIKDLLFIQEAKTREDCRAQARRIKNSIPILIKNAETKVRQECAEILDHHEHSFECESDKSCLREAKQKILSSNQEENDH